MSTVTRLDYCQFLLSSQINYTLTYFADHSERFSHDAITRYLRDEKLTAQLVWEEVKKQLVPSERGYLLFDDTVIDKNHSRHMELVRKQFSGNAHRVIRGIGVVTCVYVNPELNQFWIIDYRIFAPDDDGKTKHQHVREMLEAALESKKLPIRTVLMDGWYAERTLMLLIERLGLLYYCPVKLNRKLDESDGQQPYQSLKNLEWSESEQRHGKLVHLKDFPKGHRLRLFRLVLSAERTEYIVTNEMSQNDTDGAQQECAVRWKIEQLHREAKGTTGLESCQCRTARSQRNHIACALLVWVRLKALALQTGKTIYQLKRGLLDDYMTQQLRNPSLRMAFA